METSAERVERLAMQLNEAAVPLCLQRLEAMGERESGAYNFYAERLRRGEIFGNYELALARALIDWPQAPQIVHEIGCGFSTLSLLLAGLGFQCVGLEVDARRYAGAVALLEGLRPRFPDLTAACRVLNTRFPADACILLQSEALAITTNLVFTTSDTSRIAIIEALARYPWAIVDVDRFLTPVRDAAERAPRLAQFEVGGLVGEPFLDLGPSALFYRFGDGVPHPAVPIAPVRAKAPPAWLRGLRAFSSRGVRR